MRNQFSARWTGQVEATATGNFRFQTRSDDGVRLWINGSLVIDNWTSHTVANRRDRHDRAHRRTRSTPSRWSSTRTPATAVAKLYWETPGQTTFVTDTKDPAVCELGHSPRSPPAWPWRQASAGAEPAALPALQGVFVNRVACPARRLHADGSPGPVAEFLELSRQSGTRVLRLRALPEYLPDDPCQT